MPSKQAWVGVAMFALTILSSYLGLDKAGYINQPESVSTNTETTTNITLGPVSEHRHPDLEARIKVLETWHGIE